MMADGERGPDEPKRRHGRVSQPRYYKSAQKRPTISFRIRESRIEPLKRSAAINDLSLSEEVERRINLSFDMPNLVEEIRRVVRSELGRVERTAGPLTVTWVDDEPVAGMQ